MAASSPSAGDMDAMPLATLAAALSSMPMEEQVEAIASMADVEKAERAFRMAQEMEREAEAEAAEKKKPLELADLLGMDDEEGEDEGGGVEGLMKAVGAAADKWKADKGKARAAEAESESDDDLAGEAEEEYSMPAPTATQGRSPTSTVHTTAAAGPRGASSSDSESVDDRDAPTAAERERQRRAAVVVQAHARGRKARMQVKRMRRELGDDDEGTKEEEGGGAKRKDGGDDGDGDDATPGEEHTAVTIDASATPELAHLANKLAQWIRALDARLASYAKLAVLVVMLALYAYVLADQRQPNASFDMARALDEALVPQGTREFTSSHAAHAWLDSTARAIWADDPCGNGVCAAPFESAGFGGARSDAHGCAADCGRVADTGEARTLVVHVRSHVADSAAATSLTASAAELLADVEWNACLVSDPGTCYFPAPQKLAEDDVVAEMQNVPKDAAWTLDVRGDWFHAVGVEVKDHGVLVESAKRGKREVSATCATEYLESERQSLQTALLLLTRTESTAMEAVIAFNLNQTLSQIGERLESQLITQQEHDAQAAAAQQTASASLKAAEEAAAICAYNATSPGCAELGAQQVSTLGVATSTARTLVSIAKEQAAQGAMACAEAFVAKAASTDYLLAREIEQAAGALAGDVEHASLDAILQHDVAKLDAASAYAADLKPDKAAELAPLVLVQRITLRIAEIDRTVAARPAKISGIVPAPAIARLAGDPSAYRTFEPVRRAPAYVGTCANRTAAHDSDKCALICSCPTACENGAICTCTACEINATTNATTNAASARRRLLQSSVDISEALATLESNQQTLLTEAQGIERGIASLQATVASTAGADLDSKITTALMMLEAELQRVTVELERATSDAQPVPSVSLASLTKDRLSAFVQRMGAKSTELAHALDAKLTAVDKAAAAGEITAAFADTLKRQTTMDAHTAEKDTVLANTPCGVLGRALDIPAVQSPSPAAATVPLRVAGANNRVVGGLLVQTVREKPAKCPKSRFDGLGQVCGGDLDDAPYGSGRSLASAATTLASDLVRKFEAYNCSQLASASPLRDVTSLASYALNETAFAAPVMYCAELFNKLGLPHAFHAASLDAFPQRGYPLFFDISLSAADASALVAFSREGGYIDDALLNLDARIVVWNAALKRFGLIKLRFHRRDGGVTRVEPSVRTINEDAYESTSERVRLAFEILVLALAVADLGLTAYGLLVSPVYRSSITSKVDLVGTLMFLGSFAFWFYVTMGPTKDFSIKLRYDAYAFPYVPASPVRPGGGDGAKALRAFAEKVADLDRLCDMYTVYFMISGATLFLLLVRTLTATSFQPRLGAFVNTVHGAGYDLVNFLVVFLLSLVAYALIGHLCFGDTVDSLSSMTESLITLFATLLGGSTLHEELMRETKYNDYMRANAVLYFWSYAMLQLGLTVGFVLAVLVNAHDGEKQRVKDAYGADGEPGVLHELRVLAASLIDHGGGMRTLRHFARGKATAEARAAPAPAVASVESKVMATPTGDVITLSDLEGAIRAVAEGEDLDVPLAARTLMADLGFRAVPRQAVSAGEGFSPALEKIEAEAEKEARASLMRKLDEVLEGQLGLEGQHKQILDHFIAGGSGLSASPSTDNLADEKGQQQRTRQRRRVRKI